MRYYIITGEPSGDMHAANLVNELNKFDSNSIIRAWGGDRLIREGVSLAKDIKEISFMGLWGVINNLSLIKSNLKYCKKDLLSFKPDVLILVDYPGFNLKIAEFAKKHRIKVFYYISPKVWAWNKSRIFKIKKFVDHLLVIFPFEVEFYKKYGVEANYIGNPILDEIKKKNFILTFKSQKPIIALLPGSRKQEVKRILPVMLDVIETYPKYQFVIAASNILGKDYYKSIIKNRNVVLLYNQTYGLLSNSVAALVTSGTATLETALLNVPQIVCYRTHWLTYFLAKKLVKIEYISLVNILFGEELVKELIQSRFNKKTLIMQIDNMFLQKEKILKGYNKISSLLNKKNASKNAAKFIIKTIS
tara:strand:+ start:1747 stop:2829 length:1083 start_codon:yes stop_codon:yes gene_type:complete